MPSRSPRHRVVPVLGLLVTLAAAACVGAASPSPVPATPSPVATPTETPEFPVSLTDDEGTTVELEADPQRIVSLTPATTEILFELGAGGDVVATDSGSDFPAEAEPLQDVASFDGVDVEAIVGLDADLVVAGGLGFTDPAAIARLRELGVPVIVVYAPSVEAVYEDIQLLGDAVGESEAAAASVDSMRTEIDGIAAATGGVDRPRTFYEVGFTDTTGEIFGPADESFLAEMVTLAGGDTITTGDPTSYSIALEALIEADPEVIVIGTNMYYAPTAEQVAARTGWSVLTAVREGAVFPIDDTEISRPGPHLPDGLRELAAAIHPDVTLPAAP